MKLQNYFIFLDVGALIILGIFGLNQSVFAGPGNELMDNVNESRTVSAGNRCARCFPSLAGDGLLANHRAGVAKPEQSPSAGSAPPRQDSRANQVSVAPRMPGGVVSRTPEQIKAKSTLAALVKKWPTRVQNAAKIEIAMGGSPSAPTVEVRIRGKLPKEYKIPDTINGIPVHVREPVNRR